MKLRNASRKLWSTGLRLHSLAMWIALCPRRQTNAGPFKVIKQMSEHIKPRFSRYIGINYSGAETADCSLSSLRVYEAGHEFVPVEVRPPPSPRWHWTRRSLAIWLAEQLSKDVPTIVGIDHGFSFPLRYFKAHRLQLDWPSFLDDFQKHWPTDAEYKFVDLILEGHAGDGAARAGRPRWRRITEERVNAKSAFNFKVPGSMAKATHAGLPWLRYLRNELGERVHFWPFDGWEIPPGKSALVEVYPLLWRHKHTQRGRRPEQQDAYVIAFWLQQVDTEGYLDIFLKPNMAPKEYSIAQVEGWMLGVM